MRQLSSQDEQDLVENLTAMMGDAASNADIARRVLRKYDGDVQKAATAILEGDRGEESIQRPTSPVKIVEVRPCSPPRE
jgi:hypothetical protein